jgi:GMC oxidoreductase
MSLRRTHNRRIEQRSAECHLWVCAVTIGVFLAHLTQPCQPSPEGVASSACTSTFSRLARRSRTLRPAHSRGHQFVTRIRRLHTFRLLRACSGCFRLERIAGSTHWKAPPCHGAPPFRSLPGTGACGSGGKLPEIGTADRTPLNLYAHGMRPESKGHVHITAANARRPPAINFNFLSSPPDAELTVRAVRIARAIMTASAMTPFQVSEIAPGVDRTTDDEILDWVKKAAETTYHPAGTCKMGSDPMAVVDAQLRVHGIAGLRVADASIMPTLTSGNTNAPSIMIGEKAADMVLNTAT